MHSSHKDGTTTKRFFIGPFHAHDNQTAQDSKHGFRNKAVAFAAIVIMATLQSCAALGTFKEDTKELAQAVNFRVGVHNGRAQIEASAAGYGIGLSIGGRVITPLTPGVLSPAMPLPFGAATEPERWEIETQN